MKARVFITLKPGVLDPQGKAIHHALEGLGFAGVNDAAERGVPVIGICNGFQVLTEAGLLPGALMRNSGLYYICRPVAVTVENSQTLFTNGYERGEKLLIPIAHHDGNYQADADMLDRLEDEGR